MTNTEFQERVSFLMYNYNMMYSDAVRQVEQEMRDEKVMRRQFSTVKQTIQKRIRLRKAQRRANRIGRVS